MFERGNQFLLLGALAAAWVWRRVHRRSGAVPRYRGAMGLDFHVLLPGPVTRAGFAEALQPFGVRLAGGVDDTPHGLRGLAALEIQRGAETLEVSVALAPEPWRATGAAPAPRSLRRALAAATVRYHLVSTGRQSEYAAVWTVAAALSLAGGGIVDDPQAGAYRSAARARTDARALLASLGAPTGGSAETQFVARLRRDGYSENRIVAELDEWRAARFRKAMNREFGDPLVEPALLVARLAGRPPLDEAELALLLERAWAQRMPDAARALLAAAAGPAVRGHLFATARSIGFAAELYLGFLIDNGAFIGLDGAARAEISRAASSADVRALVAGARG